MKSIVHWLMAVIVIFSFINSFHRPDYNLPLFISALVVWHIQKVTKNPYLTKLAKQIANFWSYCLQCDNRHNLADVLAIYLELRNRLTDSEFLVPYYRRLEIFPWIGDDFFNREFSSKGRLFKRQHSDFIDRDNYPSNFQKRQWDHSQPVAYSYQRKNFAIPRILIFNQNSTLIPNLKVKFL